MRRFNPTKIEGNLPRSPPDIQFDTYETLDAVVWVVTGVADSSFELTRFSLAGLQDEMTPWRVTDREGTYLRYVQAEDTRERDAQAPATLPPFMRAYEL